MTAMSDFLSQTERQKLNLLSRHIYHFVLPRMTGYVLYNLPRKFENWLEWGWNRAKNFKVMRGVNVTIGSKNGTFYGEWKKCGNIMKPCGRGILELPDS